MTRIHVLQPVPLAQDDAFWERLHAHFDEGEIARLDLQHHHLDRDGACRTRAGPRWRLCDPVGFSEPNERTRCER
jgi:hypothetical protein